MINLRAKKSKRQQHQFCLPRLSATLLLAACCLGLPSTFLASATETSQSNLKKLSQEIIDLRAEVEALQDEVEAQKESYRSRMQSLNLKKADLTATLQREELSIKHLQATIDAIKAELAKNLSDDQNIQSIVADSIKSLRGYIEQSMPFMLEQRLQNLNELEQKLSDGSVSPYRLANQLWAAVEDEIRLHRDVGIYKQVLSIDGKEQLSDVVKVGMMTLYARTPDNTYAQLEAKNDHWQLRLLTDHNSQQAVDQLFDAVKKQIRNGTFALPNLL